MRESVRGHLSEAVSLYEDRPREQWILDFPAQVALTGSQIWWSNDMELVFKRFDEGFESALKDYNKKQVNFMMSYQTVIDLIYMHLICRENLIIIETINVSIFLNMWLMRTFKN